MSGRGTNRNLGRSVQNPGGSGRGGGGAGGANDSYGSFGAGSNADDSFARAQDINQLHYLCETVSSLDAGPDGFAEREEAWDAIRQWLRTHTAEEARQAAELTGEYKTTALHLTCRNVPPVDVVDVLLSAAPDTVEWEDSFGWLPLHYGKVFALGNLSMKPGMHLSIMGFDCSTSVLLVTPSLYLSHNLFPSSLRKWSSRGSTSNSR